MEHQKKNKKIRTKQRCTSENYIKHATSKKASKTVRDTASTQEGDVKAEEEWHPDSTYTHLQQLWGHC